MGSLGSEDGQNSPSSTLSLPWIDGMDNGHKWTVNLVQSSFNYIKPDFFFNNPFRKVDSL